MERSPHSLTSHKTVKVHEADADSCRNLRTVDVSMFHSPNSTHKRYVTFSPDRKTNKNLSGQSELFEHECHNYRLVISDLRTLFYFPSDRRLNQEIINFTAAWEKKNISY